MKYAQFDKTTYQMMGLPKDLPARWTTKEGATLNNFGLLSREALYAFGWVPVMYEDIPNSDAYYYSPVAVFDVENKQFVYAVIARDLSILLSQAEAAIDQAASDASAKYISTGVAQEMRYTQKYECAVAYLASVAAGVTPGGAACFVTAEAEACGVTPLEKAQEIVAVYDRWTALAVQIEALRIGGKVKCKACADATELLTQRGATIAALGAL